MPCLNCKNHKDLVESKQLKCNCKKNEYEKKRIKNINDNKKEFEYNKSTHQICGLKSCEVVFEKFKTKLGKNSLKCPEHYEIYKIYSQKQEMKRKENSLQTKVPEPESSLQTKFEISLQIKDPDQESESSLKIPFNHKQCNYRNCKVVFENYKTNNGKNGTKCPKHYEMSQRYNASYDTKRSDRQK